MPNTISEIVTLMGLKETTKLVPRFIVTKSIYCRSILLLCDLFVIMQNCENTLIHSLLFMLFHCSISSKLTGYTRK